MDNRLLHFCMLCICLIQVIEPALANDTVSALDRAKEFQDSNPQESIEILKSALGEKELSSDERGELFYLQAKTYYFNLSEKENALTAFYNALEKFRQSKNVRKEYSSLVYIARSYQDLYHFDLALNYYDEVLSLEGINSNDRRKTYYNVARALRLNNEFEKSINILKRLIVEFEQAKDTIWSISSKTSLALSYLDSGLYDQSSKLYREVLKYAIENSDHARKRRAINSLGFIKLKQQHYVESEQLLLEGLNLKQGTEDLQSLLVSYLNLGELYMQLKQPDKAIEYYQLGSQLDESSVNHINLIEALRQLVTNAEANGDIASALFYQKRIDMIQDPYVALSERLEQMHARYRAERIKYMHDQMQLKDELIQSQNRNIIIGLVLFAITLMAAVMIISQQRKRMVDKSVRNWLMEKNKLLYFIAGRYKLNLKEVQKELENR